MISLTMQDSQLLAGRVVLANVTSADRYRALVKAGTRESVAMALVCGLVTIRRTP